METLFELDWAVEGTDAEVVKDAEAVIGHCKASFITRNYNSNPTLLIRYNGSKNQLANRLVEINYFDDDDAKEFKAEMQQIA